MNTNRVMLFVVVLMPIWGMMFPVTADVLNTSFKLNESRQQVQKTSFSNCRNVSRASKTVFGGSSINNCDRPKRIGRFKRPRMGGLRVDACVYGLGWKKSDPKRCDDHRLSIVANDFCRSKGFSKSILVAKTSHKGKHAVLTYKKSKPSNSYWKRKNGHLVIKSIFCK